MLHDPPICVVIAGNPQMEYCGCIMSVLNQCFQAASLTSPVVQVASIHRGLDQYADD
jgi:hypothetical protein